MFVIIWEYEVRPGYEPAFEAMYGASGDWVLLFREYCGCLGTELLHAEASPNYLTVDRWECEADYAGFRGAASSRYACLDKVGDALTVREHRIGAYNSPC